MPVHLKITNGGTLSQSSNFVQVGELLGFATGVSRDLEAVMMPALVEVPGRQIPRISGTWQ